MCTLASSRDWQACACRQKSWCWGHDTHAMPQVNFWLAPVWRQGLRAHGRLQHLGWASAMDLSKVQLVCPKAALRGEAKLAELGRLGDLPQKRTSNPTQIITLYIIYVLGCGLRDYSGRTEWMQGRRSPPPGSYYVLAKGFLLYCRIIFGQWQSINAAKSMKKSGETRRVKGKQKETPNRS